MADNENNPSEDEIVAINDSVKKLDEVQWTGVFEMLVSKKKAEQRVVAVGKHRVYIFTRGPKVRLVKSEHVVTLTDIKSKNSSEVQLAFKTGSFLFKKGQADELITAVRQSFEQDFFGMPENLRPKYAVDPPSRLAEVEGPPAATLAKNCGGFSGTYQSLCDLHGTPIRGDICWDMENLLPANNIREFNMKEFEQPVTTADFRALVEALHYNNYFTGFVVKDHKLDPQAFGTISNMFRTNRKIEEFGLVAVDGKDKGFEAIGLSLAGNKKHAVTSIDWSSNNIGDKGAAALGKALGAMTHGLGSLNLDGCEAGRKGMASLCGGLKANKHMTKTLSQLNLANNKMDATSSSNLAEFLKNPNVLQDLNVSSTGANIGLLLQAGSRGCAELTVLDISHNKIDSNTAGALKNFLQATSKLQEFHCADTNIPVNVLRNLIKGIVDNKYLSNFHLDISQNRQLGVLGANMIAGLAGEIGTIKILNLNDNGFGDEGLAILAEQLCQNTSIVDLRLGDNFGGKTKNRTQTLDNLIELISSEAPIEKLDLSASRKDNELGTDLLPFIYALATNDSLKSLNISGHKMGDKGGIAIGKALQTNRHLKALEWDDNNTNLAGFVGFNVGLERNTVLINCPLPVNDVASAMKSPSHALSKAILAVEAAIFRNQNPKSTFEKRKGLASQVSVMSAGEREEIQKLRFRIKAITAGKELDSQQQKVIADAEENDTHMSAIHFTREGLQQALEDELASKLGAFAAQLKPVLENSRQQLIEDICGQVGQKYLSLGPKFAEELKKSLLAASKIDHEAVQKILVRGAGSQINDLVSNSLVALVTDASDLVFDNLFDRLENILGGLQVGRPGSPRGEPPTSTTTTSGGSVPTQAAAKPPVKSPRGKKPPAVPTKGLGDATSVKSNLDHSVARSRPLGPQRRRPQRRPARRPMMESSA
jgi:Ran GTPase-activating protein (RanGAP) involved in mRNA processing and transport